MADAEKQSPGRKLSVGLTVLFGLVSTGLAYLYVGRLRLAFLSIGAVVGLFAIVGLLRLPLTPAGLLLTGAIGIAIGLTIFIHPILIARRVRAQPAARYQRWWIYLLWFIGVAIFTDSIVEHRGTLFGFSMFRLPSSSMAPTLVRGEFIAVDTWRYSDEDPEVNELVVFELQQRPGVIYVKRVVALPSDTIEIRDDQLIRNGQEIAEPFIQLIMDSPGPGSNFGPAQVPEDHFFMLGDNRHNSADSRFIGPVHRDYLRGRVEHRWFSYDEGIRWDRFPERLAEGGE